MKLGSVANGTRDGSLVLVDANFEKMVGVDHLASTLQAAIEDWYHIRPSLSKIYSQLNKGQIQDSIPYDPNLMMAPFPRAFQWLDGSAYVNHVELVRKARGVDLPDQFWTDPLMYQGGSDHFLGPKDPILVSDLSWGVDFEGELGVVVDDVPLGVSSDEAKKHIKLIMLLNDISLRNLIPNELAKGFGFVHGKPPTAFAPVAVTPDALGDVWSDGKLNLPLAVHLNEKQVGNVNTGIDMTFNFNQLVSHAAKTRALRAGTIIGSGTVSNSDQKHGYACLAEIRMIETIRFGEPKTPFLQFSDIVKLEVIDHKGKSVFGVIEQIVKRL